MKMEPYLIPYTKINTICIKDLSIKPKTMKLLEENIGDKLLVIGLDNTFSDLTPKAKTTQVKINGLNCIRLKRFCNEKETINK